MGFKKTDNFLGFADLALASSRDLCTTLPKFPGSMISLQSCAIRFDYFLQKITIIC